MPLSLLNAAKLSWGSAWQSRPQIPVCFGVTCATPVWESLRRSEDQFLRPSHKVIARRHENMAGRDWVFRSSDDWSISWGGRLGWIARWAKERRFGLRFGLAGLPIYRWLLWMRQRGLQCKESCV